MTDCKILTDIICIVISAYTCFDIIFDAFSHELNTPLLLLSLRFSAYA